MSLNCMVKIGKTRLGDTICIGSKYYKLLEMNKKSENIIEYIFESYIYLTIQKTNEILKNLHVLNYCLSYEKTIELGTLHNYKILDCSYLDAIFDLQLRAID